MSLLCTTKLCKYKSCALCYCCNRSLCLNHLKEHYDLINSQLNLLINEINIISDQFIVFKTEICTIDDDGNLNKWHDNNNNDVINDLCQQKYIERINQLEKDIAQIRSKIAKLFCQQNTTNDDIILLKLSIRHIKQQIDVIEKKDTQIEQLKTYDFNLFNFSSIYRTILCSNPFGSSLASNKQQLLMDQRFNLHLFDQNLTLVKQYPWKHGFIRSICWSSILENFIITTNNEEIYLVNENLTSIKCIETIAKQNWNGCTCSDTSLFVTTNDRATNIFEFNLLSSFELIQQWKSPHSCQEHELIHNIIYNNQTIALVIEDSFSNMVHIELRSSITLDHLWSLRPDIKCNLFQPMIRCCSLKYDEWLLIDSNSLQLFHISKDGIVRNSYEYKTSPWNAILFGSNLLAIRTENNLNFHQI